MDNGYDWRDISFYIFSAIEGVGSWLDKHATSYCEEPSVWRIELLIEDAPWLIESIANMFISISSIYWLYDQQEDGWQYEVLAEVNALTNIWHREHNSCMVADYGDQEWAEAVYAVRDSGFADVFGEHNVSEWVYNAGNNKYVIRGLVASFFSIHDYNDNFLRSPSLSDITDLITASGVVMPYVL